MNQELPPGLPELPAPNGDGPQQQQVQIGVTNGQVQLAFSAPCKAFFVPPKQAIMLAIAILNAAVQAGESRIIIPRNRG